PGTDRLIVLKVATPLPLSVPVPIEAPLSWNVTVPVGVPDPGTAALTVAVNVTDWPNTDGLVDDATAVLVLSLLTTWLGDSVPVPPLKLPSPVSTTLMSCGPPATDRLVVLSVATPPESVPVPSVAPPSLNVTVPD